MIRKYRKPLIATTLVALLPVLAGLVLWNRLPEALVSHWDVAGQPDGTISRAFAVFGQPMILLLIQWLCFLATTLDPRSREQNRKPLTMMLWIIPLTSNLVALMIYATALGKSFSPIPFLMGALGLLFLVIGNYLPKCKPNRTLGIRFIWTLVSDENWKATHRFCGRVWVIGGIAVALNIFLPAATACRIMLAELLVMILLPAGYSYRFYRRQKASGDPPCSH